MEKDPFGVRGYIKTRIFHRITIYGEPKMHITPTVGRVVHYFRDRDSEAQVALIAKVNADGTVNLAVFDHNGSPEPRPASIPLLQEGDDYPLQGHFCGWMAHQIQVAKNAKVGGSPIYGAGQTNGDAAGAGFNSLTAGQVSFDNENRGFGGAHGQPMQSDLRDVPVLNEVVGQDGTFDGAGASGDWQGQEIKPSDVGTLASIGISVAETKTYSDGSSATGTPPLPDLSPAQQDEATRSTALDFTDSPSSSSDSSSSSSSDSSSSSSSDSSSSSGD